jgi:hypothetical protein
MHDHPRPLKPETSETDEDIVGWNVRVLRFTVSHCPAESVE